MAHENGQLDKVSKYNKILFVAGGVGHRFFNKYMGEYIHEAVVLKPTF